MKPQVRPLESEIPTSSLADVAFLLVVFFLVAWTFSVTRGLDLALPHDDTPAEEVDPVDSVLVAIDADGGLAVDSRPLPLSELLAYLEPKLRADASKPVIVRPDPRTPYGRSVDVLDELRRGATALGLPGEIQIALPTQREIDLYWPRQAVAAIEGSF